MPTTTLSHDFIDASTYLPVANIVNQWLRGENERDTYVEVSLMALERFLSQVVGSLDDRSCATQLDSIQLRVRGVMLRVLDRYQRTVPSTLDVILEARLHLNTLRYVRGEKKSNLVDDELTHFERFVENLVVLGQLEKPTKARKAGCSCTSTPNSH